jgi:hypothetical protein
MLSTTLNSQEQTVNNRLTKSLFGIIGDLNKLFVETGCPTQYDISNQVPLWVVVEKSERQADGLETLTIYDFLQKYYDWLYCDTSTGAQYQLAKNLIDLVDIEKTRSIFLDRLTKIYADGFDTMSTVPNGGLIYESNIRKFLKGIKRTFYHKKTTEDGIRYFFKTLYDINFEDVQITIPKKFILRLNGGRFYDQSINFSIGITGDYGNAPNLAGSYLNGSRMQDGNWIQEWSYLLKVGIPGYQYKDNYLNMAHPAGLKVVFEKTISDYRGPTFDDNVNTICDTAFLKNYAPYRIDFSYAGYTGITYPTYWSKIAGLTLIGLERSIGCCGASFGGSTLGFTGTTHVFPNWTEYSNYTKTNFRDINISTMFELCYPVGTVSPNSGYACS